MICVHFWHSLPVSPFCRGLCMLSGYAIIISIHSNSWGMQGILRAFENMSRQHFRTCFLKIFMNLQAHIFEIYDPYVYLVLSRFCEVYEFAVDILSSWWTVSVH